MQERPSQPIAAPSPSAAAHDITTAARDFLNLHEIVAKARQNLSQNDWDYIVGGAESETTLRRNRMAFESVAFRPRVLRDVSKVDATVNKFGRKLRLPVLLAPVGSLESFHPAGAESVARAAGEFSVGQVQEQCPSVGIDLIRRILREQKQAGKRECLGRGPAASWRRIGLRLDARACGLS